MTWIQLFLLLLFQASSLVAGQKMYVSICDFSGVAAKVIDSSKTEVALAFLAAGAQISWVDCNDIGQAKTQVGEQLFVIRLRVGTPTMIYRSVSLDTMGRAYTSERGSGFVADAYFASINLSAEQLDVERDVLLGLVIAHELGHLLLGPGHVPDGIMHGSWQVREALAMRKRWLRFNEEECTVIRDELAKRAQKAAAKY
jgi:hypothetical protein